ncbi:MAG: hypothetical protein LBL85_05520 [Methanocalculaceae archaeon]|jgi:hypothetical protein|nr:hypothetical protein [Methanocalculaceae archaeon]
MKLKMPGLPTKKKSEEDPVAEKNFPTEKNSPHGISVTSFRLGRKISPTKSREKKQQKDFPLQIFLKKIRREKNCL